MLVVAELDRGLQTHDLPGVLPVRTRELTGAVITYRRKSRRP
jgi:hypothetical protein